MKKILIILFLTLFLSACEPQDQDLPPEPGPVGEAFEIPQQNIFGLTTSSANYFSPPYDVFNDNKLIFTQSDELIENIISSYLDNNNLSSSNKSFESFANNSSGILYLDTNKLLNEYEELDNYKLKYLNINNIIFKSINNFRGFNISGLITFN